MAVIESEIHAAQADDGDGDDRSELASADSAVGATESRSPKRDKTEAKQNFYAELAAELDQEAHKQLAAAREDILRPQAKLGAENTVLEADMRRSLVQLDDTGREVGRDQMFAEGQREAFDAARSKAELDALMEKYVAAEDEGGITGGIIETPDGGYAALPANPRGERTMLEYNRALDRLEARSRIQRARDSVSERRETRRTAKAEQRQADEELKDIQRRLEADVLEDKVRREVRGRDIAERRKAELEAHRLREEQEAEDRAIGPKTYKEYVDLKIAEAREPIEAEITELKTQLEFIRNADIRRIPLANKRTIMKQLQQEIAQKVQEHANVYHKVRAEAPEIRKKFTQDLATELREVSKALRSEMTEPHTVTFAQDQDPEMAVFMARGISTAVGREAAPYQAQEYTVGKTIVQRLIYKTRDPEVFVVEEWDKNSGKLKRQAIFKGDDLLRPAYADGDAGRTRKAWRKRFGDDREVFSSKALDGLGKIEDKAVEADAGTPYREGNAAFRRRLGWNGVHPGLSTELASGLFKPKGPGFIAELQSRLFGGGR